MATAQARKATAPVEADDGEGSEVTNGVAALPLERLAGTAVNILKQNGYVETVYVGKLSINQSIAMAHVIRGAMSSLQGKKLPDTSSGNLYADLLDMFMPLMEADQLAKFFSVLIDRPTRWVLREVGLEDMARILEAVAEHNDFNVIARPFQRLGLVATQAQPSTSQPSATPEPSPPSSEPYSASETSETTLPNG